MITATLLDIFLLTILGIGATLTIFMILIKYRTFPWIDGTVRPKLPNWFPGKHVPICYFCVGFWFCLAFTFAFSCYFNDVKAINCLIASFCATGFVRYFMLNFI